ncbi:MAG: hypothetical protein B6244_11195 [Candidatus Cloacimonetes bacterium 4572_55]|nr:MAG: hypothetical protein B6244_11195 [Candidatus Cloacimonetes bacterium 4572_55]
MPRLSIIFWLWQAVDGKIMGFGRSSPLPFLAHPSHQQLHYPFLSPHIKESKKCGGISWFT